MENSQCMEAVDQLAALRKSMHSAVIIACMTMTAGCSDLGLPTDDRNCDSDFAKESIVDHARESGVFLDEILQREEGEAVPVAPITATCWTDTQCHDLVTQNEALYTSIKGFAAECQKLRQRELVGYCPSEKFYESWLDDGHDPSERSHVKSDPDYSEPGSRWFGNVLDKFHYGYDLAPQASRFRPNDPVAIQFFKESYGPLYYSAHSVSRKIASRRAQIEAENEKLLSDYHHEFEQSWQEHRKQASYELQTIILESVDDETGIRTCSATLVGTVPSWGAPMSRSVLYRVTKTTDGQPVVQSTLAD